MYYGYVNPNGEEGFVNELRFRLGAYVEIKRLMKLCRNVLIFIELKKLLKEI